MKPSPTPTSSTDVTGPASMKRSCSVVTKRRMRARWTGFLFWYFFVSKRAKYSSGIT
ncbi:MAG: hypothetical protein QM820_54710 [Minicystis sp.]